MLAALCLLAAIASDRTRALNAALARIADSYDMYLVS